MYTLTGGASFSFNPAYSTEARSIELEDGLIFSDYDDQAIGDLLTVPHVLDGGSTSLPGPMNNTSRTAHREAKGKLAASTPYIANKPRSLFPRISISAQNLIPQSNVAALISNCPCSNELDALVKLLQKNFPEKCRKIDEQVRDGEHLRKYFGSPDILSWGSLFLMGVIEEIISNNKATSANGAYLKEAHNITRKRMRKRLKEFYGLPQPPTARGYRFGLDKIEHFGEIWLDQALRCIWLEAGIYYQTIRWMRENHEDFTGTTRRPKAGDIFTEEQLRDFSDVDLDEAYKAVWLYQNRHCSKELPKNCLPNGTGNIGNIGTNGISGSIGNIGPNGTNGTNGNNGSNGTDGTDGSNASNGSNGNNGTNGMEINFYQAIPPPPFGLRRRGNFKSDPEQQIQRQLHEASSEQFTTVVTKQCIEIPLDGNPSSQLQNWRLLRDTGLDPTYLISQVAHNTPSDVTAHVSLNGSSQIASNPTQQPPPPSQNLPSNHLDVDVQTVEVGNPLVIPADQPAETIGSTKFESVGEESSSDQIVYKPPALGENIRREDATNQIGVASTPQPLHLWEPEAGSTLTSPAEVGPQPLQQPPVVPDWLILRPHIRELYRDARKAEHSDSQATPTVDAQHGQTNVQSDHEAKGSERLKPEPEPDGGELCGPKLKTDVDDVKETKMTNPLGSEAETGSSGVIKVAGDLSSDALSTSSPNKIAQTEIEGEATQSTEEARTSCNNSHRKSDGHLTEESSKVDHQPSPEMRGTSETAKGKLKDSHVETGDVDVGGPREDSTTEDGITEDGPDEEAVKRVEKKKRENLRKRKAKKRQKENRKLSLTEEATTDEQHRTVAENSAAVVGETRNETTPAKYVPLAVYAQNQRESFSSSYANTLGSASSLLQGDSNRGEMHQRGSLLSSSANTPESTASTLREDLNREKKGEPSLPQPTKQAISLDDIESEINTLQAALSLSSLFVRGGPNFREERQKPSLQEAMEHARRVKGLEDELEALMKEQRRIEQDIDRIRERMASET